MTNPAITSARAPRHPVVDGATTTGAGALIALVLLTFGVDDPYTVSLATVAGLGVLQAVGNAARNLVDNGRDGFLVILASYL